HHHSAHSAKITNTTHHTYSTAHTYQLHSHPWICGMPLAGLRSCLKRGRRRWRLSRDEGSGVYPTSDGLWVDTTTTKKLGLKPEMAQNRAQWRECIRATRPTPASRENGR